MSEFIKKLTVQCDNCDWSQDEKIENINQWHNVQCPKCNNCIIVNDDDLKVFEQMLSISNLQKHLGFSPDDPRGSTMKIDTSILRNK